MRVLIIIILFLVGQFSFAQELSIILCEKSNKEAILYANLYNQSTGNGSVTDFKGACSMYYQSVDDRFRVSHIGFETKEISVLDLLKMDTLFLERGVELGELEVFSEELKLYKYLYQIILDTKANIKTVDGKASILVESFKDDLIPLERLEALGNLTYKDGRLNSFDIKMGKFGQNKDYSFFTLTPDKELSEIDLFKYEYPIPLIITQCSKKQIKKYYQLERTVYKDYTIYSFESKNGKQFSGEVTVYNSSNTIGKLVCKIEDVPSSNLVSVYEGNDLSIIQMNLDVQFNQDCELVYFFKKQLIKLSSPQKTNNISNVIFLSNNHDNEGFEIPTTSSKSEDLFTVYEKTARFSFHKELWDKYFVFAENSRANQSFEFFQAYGYVANVSNYFSGELEEELDFNTRKWGNRLSYSDFNHDPEKMGFKFTDICFAPGFDESHVTAYELSTAFREVYDRRCMSVQNPLPDVLRFLPLITYTPHGMKDSIFVSDALPLWDRQQSYFFMELDYTNIVGVNLYYDWIKLELQNYVDSIGDISNNIYSDDFLFHFNFVLDKAEKKFSTYNDGLTKNFQYLVEWNESIRKDMQIDNFEELAKLMMRNPEKYKLEPFLKELSSIADIYYNKKEFEDALYFYGSALKYSRYFEEDRELKPHIYKRLADCYHKTDRSELAERVEQQALKDGFEIE